MIPTDCEAYARDHRSETGRFPKSRVRHGVVACTMALVASILFDVSGCGGDDPEAALVMKAGGTVNYKGQPLEQGTIQFIPDKGRPAAGTIANGKFTLTTYKEGDGAIPGKHGISIVSTKVAAAKKKGGEPETTSLIPAKLASAGTSGLIIEIPKAGDPNIEINLN